LITSAEIENNSITNNNINEIHISLNRFENASDPIASLNKCANWDGLDNI